ncbi:TlpA family protein disulfide reductase [Halobacillus yeomjeoni]|uniref:TlpA family protein disulfide reductase n=1 Tax=Halobacillus yeomjeoni TaxID=311194 RepID=A0A931MW19_9BACI|nr:TlpA disulfide reductase family protein [Halobacillus yeomjeoni]MBH0231014.1 TlpA family protein disulfide reductase [Halobacillus yeomjeoni]
MRQAPNFKLPYINSDKNYTLEEDLGKVVVLTFWASWCPDCGVDLPKKEQLYKTMDHEKVKMLTINVTGRERNVEDGMEYAEKFLTQPTLMDDGREIYERYGSQGVPTTVIIDQNGNIHRQFGDKADFLEIVESIGQLI